MKSLLATLFYLQMKVMLHTLKGQWLLCEKIFHKIDQPDVAICQNLFALFVTPSWRLGVETSNVDIAFPLFDLTQSTSMREGSFNDTLARIDITNMEKRADGAARWYFFPVLC